MVATMTLSPLIATLLLAISDLGSCQRKSSRNVAVGADVKTVINFDCPEEFGYYPHPSDCTQYYVCVFGGALLESCTGGLMYSHELQTCDWPRNVGCDGADLPSAPATSQSPSGRSRGDKEEPTRTRYTPPTPQPPQPSAIVTSRGQPRNLHHNHQEIIKQRHQQQLYEDADETLPPAEEVENDRQQRVYRGQPSTVGQVQRDRDGLRHSNAIPSYSSGRGEKIGVISFGTQQQQQQQTQYSDDDLLLTTNDLTLERRRYKRQLQHRSRHHPPTDPSYRFDGQTQGNKNYARLSPLTQFNLQPPPVQNNFAAHSVSTNGFKPFIPQYKRPPSSTSGSINYYSFDSTTPPTSYHQNNYYGKAGMTEAKTRKANPNDRFRHTLGYYNYLQPQHSHVVIQNSSELVSTTASQPLTSTSNVVNTANEGGGGNEDDKSAEDYAYREYDYSNEHFGPPPSYYNVKNKYEHIQNPFANPDFDFDEFIDKLRGKSSTTSTTTTTTTTVKPPPPKRVVINKPPPQNEYYYYYDDDEEKVTQTPKKIYSSQIKPNNLTKPADDEYYYEEYDYPVSDSEKAKVFANLSKTSPLKYSAKYQEKPSEQITKTTKLPPMTSLVRYHKSGISTTQPPENTIKDLSRQHSSTNTVTRPNTKQKSHSSRERHNTVKPPPKTNRVTATTRRPNNNRGKQRLTTEKSLNDYTELKRVEQSTAAPAPAPISTATVTARTLYNSSQYNGNNYDPYYALYDDDVELYRDVDYSQQYNSNSNNNNNNAAQNQAQPSYRRTPSPVTQTTAVVQEETPKRGNVAYVQNSYNSQDIYQPSTVPDYNEDNSYNAQVDDQNSYRQVNRQPSRGDRNDLNYIEEATTKRTTTTTRKPTTTTRTTTTSTTTPRTFPSKKSTIPSVLPVTTANIANESKTQAQSIINTIRDDPGTRRLPPTQTYTDNPDQLSLNNNRNDRLKVISDRRDFAIEDTPITGDSINAAVVNKPAPFALPKYFSLTTTTTEKPLAFHYITKSSRSTALVSTTTQQNANRRAFIVPTTYSPPKFFLKSLLPKPSTTEITFPENVSKQPHKTLKAVRKLISPINVNYGLSPIAEGGYESDENLSLEDKAPASTTSRSGTSSTSIRTSSTNTVPVIISATPTTTTTTTATTTIGLPKKSVLGVRDYIGEPESRLESRLRHFVDLYNNYTDESPFSLPEKRFRTTVEVPPAVDVDEFLSNEDDRPDDKPEPDQLPDYKVKPFPKPLPHPETQTDAPVPTPNKTDAPQNPSPVPVRASRVNAAIKSQISFGGARRQNVKCLDNSKCNDQKQQRTSANTRGRGSAHYANSANIVNNEVTANVNRGTPASRSRPTLKPSTSIVSKAAEFIDIYRFPPTRPEAIYPQPQPDKTAAKCRKDVCLLPDCSCGGKEIPGNLPVEEVPQMVLLTFDDAVNDLNKQYYTELFENDRRNPNGCPISATFYVSHEWTDYSQVQNLYADGHELASHTVSHSFGEQFSQKKWTREVAGQREILSAYGGVRLEDVRGMRAPFLSVGGNKMFKMLYDSNFTYDSSMPIYENKPPSWPYTLDYKLFHDCMIPPCPTRSYPGVWEVPMVMWQDLNGGRCSMGDACSNPPDSEGVFKMLTKNFQRHYSTNRAPFGLFYHAAWFTQPHHKEGFIKFMDSILAMQDVWLVTNWQAIQWIRDPTPTHRLGSFQPFQCDFSNRPKRCNNPKVCNLWHKSGVRYMRTCQPCPDIYPWTGNSGIRSSRIDNDIED